MIARRYLFGLTFCLLSAGACGPSGPQPIAFEEDPCQYCRMTISDPHFGAELVTDKGRLMKFDATECMVNYLREEAPAFQALYAVAYDVPGQLYPVDSLGFVISPDYRSPMGANLAAFRHRESLGTPQKGTWLDWEEVMEKTGQ